MAIDPAFFKHLEEVVPRPRHPRPQRREAAQPRQQHHQVRPRLGAHGRPDQPLQHDVRPVLHGRQPGRASSTSWRGRTSRRSSTTPSRSSRGGRCRCSSRAASRRCRRTSSTRSRYARKVGYNSVQAATNGIEFAKSPEFCQGRRPRRACATPTCSSTASATRANSHRHVGNLFDVKLRAIENLHAAGVDIVPVVTHRQRRQQRAGRPHHRVRARQPEEDHLPLVPAGVVHRPRRGGHDERRAAQRYTLSHLAHDVKNQTGIGEPMRDWFPISFMGTFTDWADLVHGPDSASGAALTCGCHPNCGIGMAVMIDKETQGGGAGHRVPQRRAARRRTWRRSTTRRAAGSCRCSAWRWR